MNKEKGIVKQPDSVGEFKRMVPISRANHYSKQLV